MTSMTNMLNNILLSLAFIPFLLFVFLNAKANVKKEVRNKQFFMPFVAVAVAVILFIFTNKLSDIFYSFFYTIVYTLNDWALKVAEISYLSWASGVLNIIAEFISSLLTKFNVTYVLLILFNVCSMLCYLIVKKFILLLFTSKKYNTSQSNRFVGIFYDFDEKTGMWYIKRHFGQAKTFIKTAYYATVAISAVAVFVSFYLCEKGLILVPFYPIFPIIIMGEVAFFIDGMEYEQLDSVFSAEIDNSRHVTNYAILRKKLSELFGDKLMSDGTTVMTVLSEAVRLIRFLKRLKKSTVKQAKTTQCLSVKKLCPASNPVRTMCVRV